MSHRTIRRILQGSAMAAALAVAGLTAPEATAAQQPIDDPAQQQPIQDQDPQQDPLNDPLDDQNQAYQTDTDMGDDGTSWGWVGLLGLAGLLGLRNRDHREPAPVGTSTRRS